MGKELKMVQVNHESRGLSEDEIHELSEMAKALGHPIRYAIIKHLSSHPSCITGELVNLLPVVQSTTSQHLKILKESGWIQGTIEGTSTCYCLNKEKVAWFKEMVKEL